RLQTWAPNSQINLSGPGRIDILPPAHTNEILADGWVPTADGQLTRDVTLHVWFNRIDKQITGTATLRAADTADNHAIQDLVADLQGALEQGNYVDQDGKPYTTFADDPSTPESDPDLRMKLYDGKLLFTS